jgi:hypothetical protein
MIVDYTADRWDYNPFHSTSYLFLPELFIDPFSLLSADYNPKSIKIMEIVVKPYNFLKSKIP